MIQYKAKVAESKRKEVDRLQNIIQKYKVIAIADMTNMPSVQLQKLRASIKDSALITMSKSRLIKIVFNKLKDKIKGLEVLEEQIRGMPALLLTNDSPFKLAKVLKKSRSSAPAKGGQIAPNDIIVQAGPTPFPPGPIMGELGQIGVKAGVVDGKVAVKEDALVVKEGNVISSQVANLLTRLGIEPMEIGINLLAALENGTIFKKDVLNADETTYLNNIKLAAQNAFNLAFNVAYPTKENIKLLIKKVYLDSNALADSRKILTSENVKKELAKANMEMEVVKGKLNLPEDFFKSKTIEGKIDTKMEKEEEVAQAVLKKLQDEKLAKTHDLPEKDKNFELEEKKAKEILKKLQDDKMKKK
ncbi:50S ribosomal protein L10 [Candidatus Woesearchaeota archaeon]|nr:50S ribosomal protein L10 [Candidatus Woesearchaeota archaeon]